MTTQAGIGVALSHAHACPPAHRQTSQYSVRGDDALLGEQLSGRPSGMHVPGSNQTLHRCPTLEGYIYHTLLPCMWCTAVDFCD